MLSQSSVDDPVPASDASSPAPGKHHKYHSPLHHGHHEHRHDKLLSQVAEWLQAEKAKRAAKRAHKRGDQVGDEEASHVSRPRTASQSSDEAHYQTGYF